MGSVALDTEFEYVRFESPDPSPGGAHAGVFMLANGLAHAGALTDDDWAWWRASNDWMNAAYPNPESVLPGCYDSRVNPGAKAWFRRSSVELIGRTQGYLDLLQRYAVPCIEVRTNSPGRIIYSDDVQVIAVPESRS